VEYTLDWLQCKVFLVGYELSPSESERWMYVLVMADSCPSFDSVLHHFDYICLQIESKQ